MKIETEQRCAVTLVKPEGPLSGQDADELRVMISDLITANMGRVVLDAAAIPSCPVAAKWMVASRPRQESSTSFRTVRLSSITSSVGMSIGPPRARVE